MSCSQVEYQADTGSVERVNDFPTCSGWLAPSLLFHHFAATAPNRQYPFHERFRIHWDNEFLGRLNEAGIFRRVHLVEEGADPKQRQWLQAVSKYSKIIAVPEAEPLVRRSIHGDSVMGQVSRQRERLELSSREYIACEVLYGCVPW